MTKDLTKLTAVQLCRQWQNEIAFSDPEQPVFVLDEWGEIERRVRHEEELEQALAEVQQAREREHAEVLRLESEIAEVCQEDYSLRECWDAVTREMDSHINARMKLQEERDALRGLLRDILRGLLTVNEALKDGDGGSYWPLRGWLDEHEVFNGDLNDLRVVYAATTLIEGRITAALKEVER